MPTFYSPTASWVYFTRNSAEWNRDNGRLRKQVRGDDILESSPVAPKRYPIHFILYSIASRLTIGRWRTSGREGVVSRAPRLRGEFSAHSTLTPTNIDRETRLILSRLHVERTSGLQAVDSCFVWELLVRNGVAFSRSSMSRLANRVRLFWQRFPKASTSLSHRLLILPYQKTLSTQRSV